MVKVSYYNVFAFTRKTGGAFLTENISYGLPLASATSQTPPRMLIDTHAHVYHHKFDEDRDVVIARAQDAGVSEMVLPAIDVASIHDAIELSERHEGVFVMAALHPSEVKDATEDDFAAVVELASHPSVVAIGESGLDYYWDRSFDDKQHDFLRRHIRLAVETDLPLILHNRDATADIIRILSEEQSRLDAPERLRGILHCFVDDAETARRVAELGFLVGIGGIVTFKNSGLAEAVRDIPLDQIVLETDAPFLAPHPHRGKRNEPAYVRLIAEKLAVVKGVEVEEIATRTTATARRLFGLPDY